MPRPAVIIGLGGTGQWVLTWLKRDLLLSNNGKMPSNVKLLEIDTATKLEAGSARVTASGMREEAIQVGDVALEQEEFVYIGGEARSLAQSVKEKEHPQIGQWFRAERWLNDLPTTAFTLDDGAGRLRQFGRLAIFKDILNEEAGSVIWRALNTKISSVLSATDEQRKLEIIIAGSFAGGTGSGLFIDVALLLRILAQKLQAHHILRGIFALPSVFTTSPDQEMLARSFAAWRELNRFMVVNPEFPMPLIRYVQNHPTFKINPTQRLFDACYLVDGRRGEQTVSAEAKYGAFPAMAEAISAVLDEEAGTKYTQWIFTNLAPEYSKRPDTPMYSAIGAYSLQVPAYFVESLSTHLYAQQILLRLLQPSVQPDSYGHLVARGASRHLSLASPDKNKEDPGFAGRARSKRLLSEKTMY
ncbi:MAG: tubulin-like doman-containing protein, partial [Candidatus Riflebacteria bacterium]